MKTIDHLDLHVCDLERSRTSHAAAVAPPGMVAPAASSREQVDAFHAAALAAGATDDGPPGLRPKYHPGYCGAFVLDPDGHDLEAVVRER